MFTAILIVAAFAAISAAQQTASRLTWSFARDNALLGSGVFKRIHPTLSVPLWSLVVNGLVVGLIGCIYLGSSAAFGAVIGTGLILQQVSIAIPAVLLMCTGRALPAARPFKLWSPLGWSANCMTVLFAVIVLVFYSFPVSLPVTGSNMSTYNQGTGRYRHTDITRLRVRCDRSDGHSRSAKLALTCAKGIQRPTNDCYGYMTNAVEISGRILVFQEPSGACPACRSVSNPVTMLAHPVMLYISTRRFVKNCRSSSVLQ